MSWFSVGDRVQVKQNAFEGWGSALNGQTGEVLHVGFGVKIRLDDPKVWAAREVWIPHERLLRLSKRPFKTGDRVRIKPTAFSDPGWKNSKGQDVRVLNGATATVTRGSGTVKVKLDDPSIWGSTGEIYMGSDNLEHITEPNRKDTMSNEITPLKSLPPVEQMTRVLEATRGTCIKPDTIQRFLTRAANNSWASKSSADVAREIEQFIRAAGKTAGYSDTEIENFLTKIGVPAKPKPKTTRVVLDIDTAMLAFQTAQDLAEAVRQNVRTISGVVNVRTKDFYTFS